MRKQLKIISICMICILSTAVFCACIKEADRTFVYDEYYVCCIMKRNKSKDEVCILELTNVGLEQEVLIIPQTINGMNVCYLGGQIPGGLYRKPTYFKSENLKKIYFPDYLVFLNSINLNQIKLLNATAVISADKDDWTDAFISQKFDKQVFSFDIQDLGNKENKAECDDIVSDFQVFCANCYFYKHNEVVWFDYIADGEVYGLPNELKTDWYLEPEYINLWNGEYVIPDGEEQLNLYSK